MGLVAIEPETLNRVSDTEAKRFLREKWALVEEHFAPAHCVLFGSRINGTPNEHSDLDLILVSDAFRPIRFVNRSYHFWELIRPHIPTTVLCYTPEEFAEMRTGIGVVPDACREGLWLK